MSIFYEATEIDSFWVCKDCFILDDDEFFKVLDKRSSQEEKEMQETINPKQEDMGESINVMEENMEETIKTEDMEIEKQKEVELNEIRSIMARLCELVNDRDLAIVRYHNYTSHLFDLEKAIKDKKNKGEVIDLLKEKQIYLRKTIKEIEKLLDIFRREISDSKKLLVRIRQDYKKVVKKKIISLEKGIKRYEFLLNGFNRIIRKTPDQIMINKEDITNDK